MKKCIVRFLFFTKTPWVEQPRLRHQIVRLLAGAGHQVIYFQKPRYPWQPASGNGSVEPGIVVRQHEELIHHKLLLAGWLRALNSGWIRRTLQPALQDLAISPLDIIVNFNYEYAFLRDVFPNNPIITIINDDFLTRTLFGFEAPLREALQRTCEISDHVLTVSTPLQRQLEPFCRPELFLPWADIAYRAPVPAALRDTLLFWGHINRRVDFDFILYVAARLQERAPELRILLVGPIVAPKQTLLALRSANIELRGAPPLDSLPLDRVFCGFIPYRSDDKSVDASTMPNKCFQLLARGLPLGITGMPHFMPAPFVYRLQRDTCVETILQMRSQFDAVQTPIRQFVAGNGAAERLHQLMQLLTCAR